MDKSRPAPLIRRLLCLALLSVLGLAFAACTRGGAAAPQESTTTGSPGAPAANGEGGPGTASGSKDASPAAKARPVSQEGSPAPMQPELPPGKQVATLAGGCFWGMEELLRQQPGVVDTEVGYTGGQTADPSYTDVKTGATGHAESVRVIFDPKATSYEAILEYFFKIHDPTTRNRQGNDVGTQYRSAIFYHSRAQKQTAERVKARVEKSGAWKQPVVTQILPAGPFTSAEDHHQDYLQNNPGGYTCHFERPLTF